MSTQKEAHKFFFNWLNQSTEDCESVVEFGSMFFERLGQVNKSVKNRIGIEIHLPYIENATFHDCIKIHGDMRDFKHLVSQDFFDCALFIDTIEHIEKDDVIELLKQVIENFKKILIVVPLGENEQSIDIHDMGGDVYQMHRSSWFEKDFMDMGFFVVVAKNFNESKKLDYIFASIDRRT